VGSFGVRLIICKGGEFHKLSKKHIREKHLHNASQFGFRARHSTTLQRMRLADHVTLNFNNKMSTAEVFLDIEKAFDITWHPGLLYKLFKLNFSTRMTKVISSFLNLGCLHPVAHVRSDGVGFIRLRNVTIVG
jgi:hypothetical protein